MSYPSLSERDRKLVDHHLAWLEFEDDRTFCRESLIIQNKQGQLVPLEWWPAQNKLDVAIGKQQHNNKPVRLFVLKTRRSGWSTGIASKLFKSTAFEDGQNALILAHEKAAARNLFGMYDRFQSNYRPFRGVVPLPKLENRTAGDESGSLRWANGSSIQIATARNVDFGRSFNFRRMHLSEYAFYPNLRGLMAALSATVPDDADTWVIKETTANGYNEAYNEWVDAVEGRSDYLPVFFGCFEDPENWRELEEPADRFQASLTDEEHDLKRIHNLALEQIYWRRKKIQNDYRGDEALFDQEYPHSWEVAFLVSGRPRFNPKLFVTMPIEEGICGGLTVEQIGIREAITFTPRPHGELIVYRKPEKNHRYGIGADPSKGVDINEGVGKADPDYSSAHVFDIDSGEQVAKLRERLTPPAFAQQIYYLARWYNQNCQVYAVVEIETNGGNGMATVMEMRRLGYPEAFIHKSLDPKTGHKTTTPGYLISQTGRQNLIANWERLLLERSVIIHDSNTIAEHRTFVIKVNSRVEHQDGCHDDDVFGAMYAGIALVSAPRHLMTEAKAMPRKYGQQPKKDAEDEAFWRRVRS